MKLKIYKITVILISLVLLTIFFLNLNYAKNNTNIVNDYISYFMPWIIIFFIVEIYILIFIKKVKYYDFGLIFIILSNFFMFGTIFLKWLNLESDIWDPVYFYSSNEMFQAISYVIPAIFLFTIGYALFGNRKITRDNIDNNSKYDDQLVYYTGIFMSIFGGIFRIICDVPTIIYMMGANTYVAYSDYAVSGFLYTFAGLFVSGVIFLMYSKKMSKFKNIIMVIVISYIVITMILTGSRKQEIFDIVTLVLCYLANLKKKISLKKVLLLFILGYLFLDLIYVIREYRTTLDLIPMKYIESIFSFNAIPILFAETLSEEELSEFEKILDDESKNKNKKQKKEQLKPFLEYIGESFRLYAGKNSASNHELVFRFAQSDDIWFHGRNIPSAHIIIRLEGVELTDEIIEFAAKVTAYYSKYGSENLIDVDYTYKKYVTKPKNTPAGFVIYKRFKTITVKPFTKEEISRYGLLKENN